MFRQRGGCRIALQDQDYLMWRQPGQVNKIAYIVVSDVIAGCYFGHRLGLA